MKLVNRKLERAAIKAITTGTPAAKRLLARLDETYFHNNFNLIAFKRIKSVLEKRSVLLSWRELLQDPSIPDSVRTGLASFKEKPVATKQATRQLYESLAKYRRFRLLNQLAKDINDGMLGDGVDDEKLIERARDTFTQVVNNKTVSRPLILGKGDNAAKMTDKVLAGKAMTLIPLGIKAWDEANGGVALGSFVMLGGYTGDGKSIIGSKIADNFADHGLKVGEMSLEMDQEETLMRRLARYSRIDMTKILKNDLSPKEKKRIAKAREEKMEYWQERGASVETHTPETDVSIEDVLLTVAAYGYQALIIDYASLLKDTNGDDFWRKLGDVARACKLFAKHNNCIVVLLVQTDEKNSVKFSKSMATHSDLVFIISYDENRDTNEIVEIEVPKARKQKRLNFALKKEYQYMDIADAPPDALEKMKKKDIRNKKKKSSDDDEVEIRRTKIEETELDEFFADVDDDD